MFPLTSWQVTLPELSDLLERNPSLRGFLFGYIAQDKLIDSLRRDPRIEKIEKKDDHDRTHKGHINITYKGLAIRLEARSPNIRSIRKTSAAYSAIVQCDASDKRTITVKNQSITTTFLKPTDFDILATCIFPFTGSWDFIYCLSEQLPRSTYARHPPAVQKELIKGSIRITWPPTPPFVRDPFPLFDQIVAQRKRKTGRKS